MKTLLLFAIVAASCCADEYRLQYLNGIGDGFTVMQDSSNPTLLFSTGNGSYGNFELVTAGGSPADPTTLAAPGQATSSTFFAQATITTGAEITQFQYGNGSGPFFSDYSVFEYSLSSFTPGTSFTFEGSQIGTSGSSGVPTLTVTDLTPEPAALSLVGIGLTGLVFFRSRRSSRSFLS